MQKMPEPHMDLAGSQTNFFYGAPAPYAESIAPSHHSTYAHYFEDEDDEGWEMPNFYNETYMQGMFFIECIMNIITKHVTLCKTFLIIFSFYF